MPMIFRWGFRNGCDRPLPTETDTQPKLAPVKLDRSEARRSLTGDETIGLGSSWGHTKRYTGYSR